MSDRKLLIIGFTLMAVSFGLTTASAFLPGGRYAVSYSASGRMDKVTTIGNSAGEIAVNYGSADELCKLHGIGKTLAQMIVLERNENGYFYYPEDLLSVKGIGRKKLAQFQEMLDLTIPKDEE